MSALPTKEALARSQGGIFSDSVLRIRKCVLAPRTTPALPISLLILGRDEAATRVGRVAVARGGPKPPRKLLRLGLRFGSQKTCRIDRRARPVEKISEVPVSRIRPRGAPSRHPRGSAAQIVSNGSRLDRMALHAPGAIEMPPAKRRAFFWAYMAASASSSSCSRLVAEPGVNAAPTLIDRR